MPEVVYCGVKGIGEGARNAVWRRGVEFTNVASLRCIEYTRNGWQWGAINAGARQLAYALLLDILKSRAAADKGHKAFCRAIIAQLPAQWVLTGGQVRAWYQTASKELLQKGDSESGESTDSAHPCPAGDNNTNPG